MKIYRNDGSLITDDQMKKLLWFYHEFNWFKGPDIPEDCVLYLIYQLLLAGV